MWLISGTKKMRYVIHIQELDRDDHKIYAQKLQLQRCYKNSVLATQILRMFFILLKLNKILLTLFDASICCNVTIFRQVDFYGSNWWIG